MVTTSTSPGLAQLDRGVDHQVVAGLAQHRDRRTRHARRVINRPHIRRQQARAALRFVDRGHAHLAENLHALGVRTADITYDSMFHIDDS